MLLRVSCFFISLICVIAPSLVNAQVVFTQSNLPIVVINTNGQPIPDEPKITAEMGIIDNGSGQTNHLTDPFNGYDGLIGIELRGSTSQFYDKKPYSIELRDEEGEDRSEPLLGMPEESDWALIAPLNDKTLMRDVLAHALAQDALEWSPRSRYCEVVINGEYMGVYSLIERIKRDKNRVDISKIETQDTLGDALTGGYILRMDKYGAGGPGGNWFSPFPPLPGGWQQTWFQFDYPKEEDIHPKQAAYIQDHITSFEYMLNSPGYATQYPDWIDVDSWVNYLLVEEIAKNTDGYRLSAYFSKDRDSKGGKIKMGPVWDFNIAFGLGDYCEGQSPYGWAKDFNSICNQDTWLIHFWWNQLWSDQAFKQKVGDRWTELRNSAWTNDKIFGKIDSIAALLDDAQDRNFDRWPVLGTYVWPNAFVGQTYQQEVTYLKNWLTNRLNWLDLNIDYISTVLPPPGPDDPPFRLFPNPVQDKIFIVTDEHPNQTQKFDFSLYDLNGRQLFHQRITGKGLMLIQLPEGKFTRGTYVYRAIDRFDKVWTGKVFVE